MAEQDTGICASAHTSTTSYRLELHDVYEAPANPTNHNRHVYGVGEKVQFSVMPRSSEVLFRAVKGDTVDWVTQYDKFSDNFFLEIFEVSGDAPRIYVCPISATYVPDIVVSNATVVYRPSLTIVEPQYVVTRRAWTDSSLSLGTVAPGILKTENYIGPMNVSFMGVKVAEIPCTNILPRLGWYTSTNFTGSLSHDMRAGAGNLRLIKSLNYWMSDEAGREIHCTNWYAGRLVWNIPIGWMRKSSDDDESWGRITGPDFERWNDASSRPLLIGGREDAYQQIFIIDEDGTAAVEKFGYRLSRSRFSWSGSVILIREGGLNAFT